MILIDLRNLDVTGKEAEDVLGRAGITVNKNAIPFDPQSPLITSGIRIGTPAVTTRGMGEQEMVAIAELIVDALKNRSSEKTLNQIKSKTSELCREYPLYREFE